MDIELNRLTYPPELAVCWYMNKMLANPIFLPEFVRKYTGYNLMIKTVKIMREEVFKGKQIDSCIYIIDENDKHYGLIIEAKTHWANDKQLNESVAIFKKERPDYQPIGLHFLITVDKNQLSSLANTSFQYPVILIQDFLKLYCELGIKYGYSLQLASNLQDLLYYKEV